MERDDIDTSQGIGHLTFVQAHPLQGYAGSSDGRGRYLSVDERRMGQDEGAAAAIPERGDDRAARGADNDGTPVALKNF